MLGIVSFSFNVSILYVIGSILDLISQYQIFLLVSLTDFNSGYFKLHLFLKYMHLFNV